MVPPQASAVELGGQPPEIDVSVVQPFYDRHLLAGVAFFDLDGDGLGGFLLTQLLAEFL